MTDGRERLPPRLAEWLASMRQALVAGEPAYSPPGARPGRPSPVHSPKGPSREVRFLFASDTDDPVRAWRASLSIPPDAGVGTSLELSVTCATGGPVSSGTFHVAGCAIPVFDGKGSLPLELFVAGLRDVRVALSRPDGSREDGVLSFFDPEDV